MATDPTRIWVSGLARVYLAPVGTIAPDGTDVVWPTGWKEVGLFTPDSLQWATNPTFESVTSHQSNYPTRRFQTTDEATLQVDLQEWSAFNFKAVFGGGTFTKVTVTGPPAGSYFRFAPPRIGARDTISAGIELVDGTNVMRRIIPRAQQVEGVSQTFTKTAASILPLRLTVLGGDLGDSYYDLMSASLTAFDPATLA